VPGPPAARGDRSPPITPTQARGTGAAATA
jgi:hypothetical protein